MENHERLAGLTYHLVPRDYYEAQDATQDYRPEPMIAGREDFIHCTDGAQNLADTANRYYTLVPGDFLALVIDLARLNAPARYDAPSRIFPHIYGPLNRNAIVEIVPVPRQPDGRFLPPSLT